jgi:hypothetical protein
MKRNDIILTGLIGSNPLGALSAFGLLRICDEIPALKGARLSWGLYHDWTAVLNTPGDICKDELLELMIARQQKRSLDIFGWSDDIKVDPKEYHEILKRQAEAATLHNRLDVDYFAAFGSDIVTARSTADVKPTAFHMTAGRQKFLNSIQKLGNSMKKDTKKAFEEALFGPWKYADKYHSLYWDPSTERLHALCHLAPTKEDPRCVRGAIWLAIEALPLFPTAAIYGRLATTGFTKDKPVTLVWPIWKTPISLDMLRTLLMTSDDKASLERRGVIAIYRSVRSESDHGAAILRPAIEQA